MIKVYTTEHCPQCKLLTSMLDQSGLPYETCTDTDEMLRLGISSIPVMQVDDKMFRLQEALKYLNER